MIRHVPKKVRSIRAALAVAVGVPFLIAVSANAQGTEAAPTATPAGQAANAPSGTGSGQPNTGQSAPNQTQTNANGTSAAAAGPSTGGTNTGSAETERVIVTGSNIPTAEEVGPNPVLNLNRDLINKSGERTTEELLRQLPVANAQGIPIANNTTGFTPAASSISLRGFDPSATLVLIDGRRYAPYPVGQSGTQSFQDINGIPRAAIESIEVLKDGASTTYGADAVAGVVNIKLRHNYRGAEATVEYGNTLDKDSGESAADLIFGVGDENTQVTGVIDYYRRNSIFNRDRGYSQKPPFLSSNSSPFNLQLNAAAVVLAGGTPVGTRTSFFGHAPFGSNGTAPASAYTYSAGRTSVYNFNTVSGAFPESERYGGFLNGEHKICGDQLVLYADMFYTKAKSHQELAPGATGSFVTPGQTTLYIPPNSPVGFIVAPNAGAPDPATLGAPPGAFNPFNPFNQFISNGTRARLAEFGNRTFDFETDNFLATVGLKGDKLFDGTWGYDIGFRYSEDKNTSSQSQVSGSLFNRILNAADPIFDPTNNQYIGTTIPYNPFGDYRNAPATNAATVAFATVHPKDIDISKLATLDATIYTTSLFKLPAGGVGFATGAQFRRENESQDVDQLEITGDIIGSSKLTSTNAGRKDYAFYAETNIPIFSPEMNVRGFRSLEFNVSARYEAFENNDTNVLVPKIGVRWQPLDDSLTLRSTWGEGFREPSLFELFAGPTNSLTAIHDPQTGNNEPEEPFTFNSNPNLQPEDSRSFSAGVVWTPHFVNGLTLSVDVWEIQRTGIVVQPSAQQVINREQTGTLLPGEEVDRDPATGLISRVVTSFQNAGQERARGIDFGMQYQYQTSFGTFTSLSQATYLDSFRFSLTTGNPALEIAGSTVGGMGQEGFLKWKGRSRLDWAWKGFDVNATLTYTDGYHELLGTSADYPAGPFPREHYVHQTWFIDGQASYAFAFAAPVENQPVAGYSKGGKEMVRGKDGKAVETSQTANASLPCWKNLINNTTLTVGCNNIFGQDPPKAFGFEFANSTNYPGFLYDPTGRFVYASLTKKF